MIRPSKYLAISSVDDAKEKITSNLNAVLKEKLILFLELPNKEGGLIVSDFLDDISIFPGSLALNYSDNTPEIRNRDGWLGNTKVTRGCVVYTRDLLNDGAESLKSMKLVYNRAKKHQALTGSLID